MARRRFFHAGSRVALYLPFDRELDTALIAAARRRLTPISAQWLDLIVVPLVGVDRGTRLGPGAGYYDRALAFRRRRRFWKGPHLVGFAFDYQRTSVNFADAWDVRLDSLATESGVEHYL